MFHSHVCKVGGREEAKKEEKKKFCGLDPRGQGGRSLLGLCRRGGGGRRVDCNKTKQWGTKPKQGTHQAQRRTPSQLPSHWNTWLSNRSFLSAPVTVTSQQTTAHVAAETATHESFANNAEQAHFEEIFGGKKGLRTNFASHSQAVARWIKCVSCNYFTVSRGSTSPRQLGRCKLHKCAMQNGSHHSSRAGEQFKLVSDDNKGIVPESSNHLQMANELKGH